MTEGQRVHPYIKAQSGVVRGVLDYGSSAEMGEEHATPALAVAALRRRIEQLAIRPWPLTIVIRGKEYLNDKSGIEQALQAFDDGPVPTSRSDV